MPTLNRMSIPKPPPHHKKTLNAHRLFITGPTGGIEAVRSQPTAPHNAAKTIAVICHPHPLYGGNLNNKVVYTLARSFHQLDIPTIRFNFRGVGRSQGEYDNGNGELQDLFAVINHAQRLYPNHHVYLAGFSFGAYIALKATPSTQPDLLVTVAPPVNIFDFANVSPPRCPWLLIQGLDDEIVDSDKVIAWSKPLIPAPQLITMKGTGHFFHNQLNALQTQVLNALANDELTGNQPIPSLTSQPPCYL